MNQTEINENQSKSGTNELSPASLPILAKRFWIKVNRLSDTECWPWIGSKRTDGYGVIRWHNCQLKAHRVAWILTNPDQRLNWLSHNDSHSMVIDHTCSSKDCCNPAHLEAVSQSVNAIRYQRSRFKGLCIKGHAKEYGRLCKTCWTEYMREYRKSNRDRINYISRKSYERRKAI